MWSEVLALCNKQDNSTGVFACPQPLCIQMLKLKQDAFVFKHGSSGTALGMLRCLLDRREEGGSSLVHDGSIPAYTHICLQPCPCWHSPYMRMLLLSNMLLQSTALSTRPI